MGLLATKRVRVAAALTLASSVALGSVPDTSAQTITAGPPDRAERIERLVDAFNMPMTGRDCGSRDFARPLIAHLEYSTFFFLNENWSLHGDAAAQTLADRVNHQQGSCIPVHHLDISPIYNTEAMKEAAELGDLLTVSSNLYWNNYPGPTAAQTFLDSPDIVQKQEPFLHHFNPASMGDFWDRQSNAIIVMAAGNDGENRLMNKANGFLFSHEADSLLIVGSLRADGTDAPYSSHVAPDLVTFESYAQGFRGPISAGNSAIRDFYNHFMQSSPPNQVTVSITAGMPVDDVTGTSFAAPDNGGFMADARLDYPDMDSNEIVVAAMLSTTIYTQGQQSPGDFIRNAAGLPFDAGDSGHGAFLPGLFQEALAALDSYKTNSGETSTFGRVSGDGNIRAGRHADFDFPDGGGLTIVRTIGELEFARRADTSLGVLDQFPQTVKVVSPSGTAYQIPLRMKSDNGSTVTAAFSTSPFLGEQTPGPWRIEVPPGEDYRLVGARLTHTGAEMGKDATLRFLMDVTSKALQGQRRQPVMEAGPWQARPAPAMSGGVPSPSNG